MKHLSLAVFALTSLVRGASIRHVDFKNFSYPFIQHKFVSLPNKPRWLPLANAGHVILHDGRYSFPCDDPRCELITFDSAIFGKLHGLGEVAIATMVFHTGGTAKWEYLYVVAIRSGRPRVVKWLEAGSRADMGLRGASVDQGDLVLIVNDPQKREGDCCSTGTITYRYRWQRDSFRQMGVPVRKADPR
jgi:hypothetical protein